MNSIAKPSFPVADSTQEKYRRKHSLSGKVSCAMALLGLFFGIVGMAAHLIGGRLSLLVILIAWPAMFSFCIIGLALAIHGVIPRRRIKTFPIIGLLANPLILVLFLVYFWWPTPDTLVTSAALHDREGIDRALILGVSINEPALLDHDVVRKGSTALTAAAQQGHKDIVAYLIQRGADINLPDEGGMTALDHAVAGSHTHVVEYLLERNAEVNRAGAEGYPVSLAAKQGHQIILEMLLAHGAKVSLPGRSPLHEAAEQGHSGIATLLIKAGADVNHKDDVGRSPLHYAAANGHIHLVKMLMRSGADVNQADDRNIRPLELAIDANHEDVVKELLSRKATIGIFMAIVMNNASEVKRILNTTPDAVHERHKGRTPLHEAVQLGQRDVVRWLLEQKADVNDVSSDTQHVTPLHLAVMHGHHAIARLLLEHKADVNAIAKTENVVAPALYFAVDRSDKRMAALLLENGADVNALCEATEAIARPIFFAVHKNDPAMIQLLLKFKADIDGRRNASSPSPLYEAVKLGYIDIVAQLVNNGANVQLPVGDMTPLALAENRRNRDPMVYERIMSLLNGEVRAVVNIPDIEE